MNACYGIHLLIFQIEHILAMKLTRGYDENVSFLINMKNLRAAL